MTNQLQHWKLSYWELTILALQFTKAVSGCIATRCDNHQFCGEHLHNLQDIVVEHSGLNKKEYEKCHFGYNTLLHSVVFHVAFVHLFIWTLASKKVSYMHRLTIHLKWHTDATENHRFPNESGEWLQLCEFVGGPARNAGVSSLCRCNTHINLCLNKLIFQVLKGTSCPCSE